MPPELSSFRLSGLDVPLEIWGATPDVEAGNAQFFDLHPACLIQIRPLLPADYGPCGIGRPSNTLLYAYNSEGKDIVCYLTLPRQLRKNVRKSIMLAVEMVVDKDREIGLQLRRIAARTR